MSGFNVNRFRSEGINEGGVRPTLFSVTLEFPNFITVPGLSNKMTLTTRGSEIPESIIGSINVPFFGRDIKLAGDRVVPDWSTRIMMDNFLVRDAFEKWHNAINTIISNRLDENVSGAIPALGNSYKTIAYVTVFDKKGPGDLDGEGVLRSYRFDGLWPKQLGSVRLDWNAKDEVAEFDVLFSVDWVEPLGKASEGPVWPTELTPA